MWFINIWVVHSFNSYSEQRVQRRFLFKVYLRIENKTNLILNYIQPSKGGSIIESNKVEKMSKGHQENLFLQPPLKSLVAVDQSKKSKGKLGISGWGNDSVSVFTN